MVLEKTLESSLDCKEIKPVNPKENQPSIFIGRTDADTPILWPHDVKSQHIWKDSNSGKDWRHKEKGQQRIRWLDSITRSVDVNLRKLWEIVKDRKVCCAAIHGVEKSQTQLRDWATRKTLPSQKSSNALNLSLKTVHNSTQTLPYLHSLHFVLHHMHFLYMANPASSLTPCYFVLLIG